jgi:hypothetical protein
MIQFLLLLALVIPAILFFLTQQRTLDAIETGNRMMNPSTVWFQLIPIVGEVLQFFVVARIAGSIQKEIASRQDDSLLGISNTSLEELDKRPTFGIGIAYCILITIGFVLNFFYGYEYQNLRLVGSCFSLSGMICWIIYWVKLAQYKDKLNRLKI